MAIVTAAVAGCDQLSRPNEPIIDPAPVEAAPPPQTEPMTAPPRTGAQIFADFEALTPPLRNDERLLELSQQADAIPGITRLDLGGSAVTDGGAECLPQFTAVAELNLTASRVSGKSLEYVARMQALQKLTFDDVRIDDEALAPLAQAPALGEISLNGTSVSDLAFEHLSKIEGLRALRIGNNDHVMGQVLSRLIKEGHFRGLTEIRADGTLFGYGGLEELGSLKELQTLSLNSCDVTDEALLGLRACTSLRSLSLGNNKFTNEGLKSLARLKDLEELHLQGNVAIDDGGLTRLRGFPALKVLSLDGTRCTLEAARDLKEKSLKETTIRIAGQEL
jgi:Leucine-rich repeat (LRR) protein